MVHTAFQGIADGLLSTDSLLKISAMRNILGYSIVVVCISILINKSSPLQVCLFINRYQLFFIFSEKSSSDFPIAEAISFRY